MSRLWKVLLPFLILLVAGWIVLPLQSKAAPSPVDHLQTGGHTASDLIDAVNRLRLENGLNELSPHPSLMQVAQWEADAIAGGAPGHTRPPGLTLGAWMISLGYPLGGNIALDGYRSENWVAGSELTVDEAIQLWLGDAPHTNTMLSAQRSDIGAGVALGEDPWGKTVYYYVIETALQTTSGQQQYEASALLTALPQTQAAIYGDPTQAAVAASISQYMIPVSVATARPDGDVIHEVRHGQSLWSIAIEYGVKINQIKLLNNLTSNQVYTGQKLLVQKSATQPATIETPTQAPSPSSTPEPLLINRTTTPKPALEAAEERSDPGGISILAIFLILIVLVAGMAIGLVLQDRRH